MVLFGAECHLYLFIHICYINYIFNSKSYNHISVIFNQKPNLNTNTTFCQIKRVASGYKSLDVWPVNNLTNEHLFSFLRIHENDESLIMDSPDFSLHCKYYKTGTFASKQKRFVYIKENNYFLYSNLKCDVVMEMTYKIFFKIMCMYFEFLQRNIFLLI